MSINEYRKTERIYGKEEKNKSWQPVSLDSSTNTMQIIEYEHHEVHSGRSFVFTQVGTVAGNATRDVLVVTPDTTRYIHMTERVASDDDISIYIYESPNLGAGATAKGSQGTAYNRNRGSSNSAGASIFTAPTILANGTALFTWRQGTGGFFFSSPGESRGEGELVLARNATYLYRVVNNDAAGTEVEIQLNWYEHVDKN